MTTETTTEITATMNDGLTRGHKKKARTRQQLLDAALRIYARKGAGDMALNELAEECGVSNGTVYNYFRTREEVLEAVAITLAEQHSLRVLAVSIGVTQGAERMSIAVRMFIRRALEDHDWASAVISVIHYAEGMRSAMGAFIRNDLQIGTDQGDFHFMDMSLAMGLVASVTISGMTAIVEDRIVPQHDSIIAEMILLALGVSTEAAKRIAHLSIPEPATFEN
jgi:AcrR family transcriptional regulator